jgi:hypothetical protein
LLLRAFLYVREGIGTFIRKGKGNRRGAEKRRDAERGGLDMGLSWLDPELSWVGFLMIYIIVNISTTSLCG